MNSTKTKLVSAIAMLVVASIMMTSASFAWFTVSTAPRIDNLEVSMAGTRNYEIAAVTSSNESSGPSEPKPGDADDTAQGTWGATVSFSSASALVFPATLTGGALKSVNYASDGRIDDYTATSLGAFTDGGAAYYYADIDADSTDEEWVTVGAVYGIFLRSNVTVSCKVSMSSIEVVYAEGSTTDAEKAYLSSTAAVSLKFIDMTDNSESVISAGGVKNMTANTIYKVYVTAYFDGEKILAKDIAKGLKVSNFNIEFTDTDSTNTKGTSQGGVYSPLMNF